jgi:hypothetical protein
MSKNWELKLRKKLDEELSSGLHLISEGNWVVGMSKQSKIDFEVDVLKELIKKGKRDV